MKDVLLVTINETKMHYDCEMLGLEILYNSLHDAKVDVDIFHCEYETLNDVECRKVAESIVKKQPKMVGFSPYFINVDKYHEIAVNIKKMNPDIFIVVGGGLCTFAEERILEKYSFFDVASIGEGEQTTVELAKTIINKTDLAEVKGIAYRKGIHICKNQNREVIDMNASSSFERIMLERNPDVSFARINSARGCLANCTFCVESKTFAKNDGARWRGKSPALIVEEFKYIHEKYHINTFAFTDNSFEDSLIGSTERIRELCYMLINSGMKVYFSILVRGENFCSEEAMDDIRLLRKAGLYSALVGCETGYEKTMKLYGKNCTVEQAKKAIANFHSVGVVVPMGFITFNPYSTLVEFRANIEFIKDVGKLHYWVGFENKMQLFYGAPLLEKVRRDGLLTEDFDVNNPYGYKFVDDKIKWLTDNLFDTVLNLPYLHVLNWQIMDFENDIAKFIAWNTISDKIDFVLQQYNDLKNEIGKQYYSFFDNLISIAETTLSKEELGKIAEEYLANKKSIINITKLNKLRKIYEKSK